MSLLIKSVELSNIRTHKHFLFTPKENGITAIAGPNGTGKSTIVDSISWCLFGTKPEGVSKASSIIRSGIDFKKEKVFVKVRILVNEKEYLIHRKMVSRHGATECTVSTIDENGDEDKILAGPAVSHTEPEIRKLLQMDEKGFLSAILVQQKQVDKLIVSTPRERGEVIEKLMGISSITSAIIESRQELNNLRKLSSVTTFDDTLLTQFKKDLISLNKESTLVNKEIEKLREKVEFERDQKNELSKFINAEMEKIENNRTNNNRISTLNELIESKTKELQNLIKEKDLKKKSLPTLFSSEELKKISSKKEELIKEKSRLWESAHSINKTIKDLKLEIVEAEEIIESSKVKDISEAKKNYDNLQTKLEELIEKEKDVNENLSLFKFQIESIESAIKIIEEKEGHCPTCLQQVKDVSKTVSTLTKNKDQFLKLVEEKKGDHKDLKIEIKKKNLAIEKYEILIKHLSSIEPNKEKMEVLKKDYSTEQGEYKSVNAELDSIEKTLLTAKENEIIYNEYNRILSKAQTMSEDINNFKKELEDRKTKNVKTISDDALNSKKNALEEHRASLLEVGPKLASKEGEEKLIVEKTNHIQGEILKQELEKKNFQKLLKDLEVMNNTVKVLEEFRADRIDKSVPLIENYASELLSRFTDGMFTQLKLDSKFKATVVLNNGVERDVGLLSGGEMSAAAMALRLSISIALSGNSSENVIILDEVLVSQDASRAEQILAIIKDVCHGQVIFIAHNDSINDIADELVELN